MPPVESENIVAVPLPRSRRLLWWGLLATVLVGLLGAGIAGGLYEFGKRKLPPSGGCYFVRRVELPVSLYLQGDPVWGKDQLGESLHTIGQVGCAMTSAAMVMRFYGIDTDPGRLNVFLREHGGYDEDNDLRWEGPTALAPERVRHAYEDLPSYYLIDSNLLHGNPVIVRLRLSNGVTHFVVVMGKEGFDYLIRDPSMNGLRKGVYPLKEIGSDIEALRFYEKLTPKT